MTTIDLSKYPTPRTDEDADGDNVVFADIIRHVKEATDRTITVETIQRVQRGDYLEHHPTDAAILAGLQKF